MFFEFILAQHKGYTSKRKISALEIANIEAAIAQGCGCQRVPTCHEHMDTNSILRWRKKYHLQVMGFEQQQKLLELYKESIFENGSSKVLHLVEGKLVCK